MVVIGLDDTDSRERGMCTTYVAARIAARLRERDHEVSRSLLVRLNPAVAHKTRGNAALAIHTDAPAEKAFALAGEAIDVHAETADPKTNPGLVVAPDLTVPDPVAAFAERALTDLLPIAEARERCMAAGFGFRGWANGRGLVGALAAVGAWRAFSEWTAETIHYREPGRWGTPREIDAESVFAAASRGYPKTWDTVDRDTGDLVCVPHTPCPICFGIRGDDTEATEGVAGAIESEPISETATFLTNQGTDSHLQAGSIAAVENGRSYRLPGVVSRAPETREGGHVHFVMSESHPSAPDADRSPPITPLDCVAFEPTKRFRDRVRSLRVGDRLTACGEVGDGTLKLEKFAVRDLVRTRPATPTCPSCGRTMKSAGRDQGYRCRDCETRVDGKVSEAIDRDLDVGWYEVPPSARRHIAKPLVRGGFDAPTHPER
jgi:tRNA(Ile2)-agmatinylcytidine synthase